MPVSVEVYNSQGEAAGTLDISDSLLGQPENPHVVRAALDCYLANQRSGSACAKTRGEVRGGGRKPWRQKGTGRARVGSIRSPIWRGGGATFGPRPRDYSYRINRKVRAAAMLAVLSSLAREKRLVVLDRIEIAEPKTRAVVALRDHLRIEPGQKVLILTEAVHPTLRRAAANLEGSRQHPTSVSPMVNLNVFALLTCDYLIVPTGVLKALEEVYA